MKTTSHDLHPVRWARKSPFSKTALTSMRGRPLHADSTMDHVGNLIAGEMMDHYNRAILQMPVEQRPTNIRFINGEIATGMKAAAWFWGGRHAFILSDGLHQALARTDLGGVRVSDVQYPYEHFYLSLAGRLDVGLPGSDNVIDGAYVSRVADTIEITLTTRRQDAAPDNPKRWPWNRDPTFYVPLSFDGSDATFEELLDRSIRSGDIPVGDAFMIPDEIVEAVEVDGRSIDVANVTVRNDAATAAENKEAMPAVKKALALIVNTLAWLTAKPEDASGPRVWTTDVPQRRIEATLSGSRRQRDIAVADLLNDRYARVRVLGSEINYVDPSAGFHGGRQLQESFWRRGHWRRQFFGEGRLGRRLQWIGPSIVRPDLGEPSTGRIYDLEAPDVSPSPPDPR